MIFRFLILLLCVASASAISQSKEDSVDTSKLEEIMPVAPQSEDGFEGQKQNSFGAPESKSFSSELLSSTRKKSEDRDKKKGKASKDTKGAAKGRAQIHGKAKNGKTKTAGKTSKPDVKKSAKGKKAAPKKAQKPALKPTAKTKTKPISKSGKKPPAKSNTTKKPAKKGGTQK